MRGKQAALKVLKKAMPHHGRPAVIVTDRLRSCGAALKEVGAAGRQDTGRWLNIRAESSTFPRRELAMLRFRQMRCLQKFAAVHFSVRNHFSHERNPYLRDILELNHAAALFSIVCGCWRELKLVQLASDRTFGMCVCDT
jgi:putative transposase